MYALSFDSSAYIDLAFAQFKRSQLFSRLKSHPIPNTHHVIEVFVSYRLHFGLSFKLYVKFSTKLLNQINLMKYKINTLKMILNN